MNALGSFQREFVKPIMIINPHRIIALYQKVVLLDGIIAISCNM